MKFALSIFILISVLLAGVFETKEGTFLEIYADDNLQSNIVANVSIDKGKLEKHNC